MVTLFSLALLLLDVLNAGRQPWIEPLPAVRIEPTRPFRRAGEVSIVASNPLLADTDGDSLPDGYEWRNGLKPLVAQNPDIDTDGDGLTDGQEYRHGTAANKTDTDGDGLRDGVETNTGTYVSRQNTGTDPNAADSDGDGLPDGWEVTYRMAPLADDAQTDIDRDGVPARLEFLLGTSPTVADSAGELMICLGRLNALWPLRTGFADASGHALDLTASDAAVIADGHLTLGAAGWAESPVAPPAMAVAAEHSFSVWFRSNGGGTVLAAGDPGASVPTATVRVDSSGSLTASVAGNDADGEALTVSFVAAGVGEGWHHVALAWSTSHPPVVFLDGEQVQVASGISESLVADFPGLSRLLVGARMDGTGATDAFCGDIAAVSWFGTVMASRVATQLAAIGHGYDIASLVAFDGDADGLPDRWECLWLGGTKGAPGDDPDHDGLTNLQEYQNGCDPRNSSTDGDGLTDGEEVNIHGTDPLARDTDGDGLTDREEVFEYQTDPCLSDTDGDGLTDVWEIGNGLSPLLADTDTNGTADGDEDEDGDGLANAQEHALGSDPRVPDVGNAVVSFASASTSVAEASAVVQVQAVLSEMPPNRDSVTVSVVADGGTAALASDYQYTTTALTFSQGSMTASISVQLLADANPESTETVVLRLTQCRGARAGKPAIHTVIIADAIGPLDDTDADGLPDPWEMRHFGNLAQGPADDSDGDGMNNLLEYKIGSRPDKGFRAATAEELNLRVTGTGR